MECCECDWCGDLFWANDTEQGMCPTCKEQPDEGQKQRFIRQTLDYINSKRGSNESHR